MTGEGYIPGEGQSVMKGEQKTVGPRRGRTARITVNHGWRGGGKAPVLGED